MCVDVVFRGEKAIEPTGLEGLSDDEVRELKQDALQRLNEAERAVNLANKELDRRGADSVTSQEKLVIAAELAMEYGDPELL